MPNALQLPHWLMIAGALFVVGGSLGLVLARKQGAVAPASPPDNQPSERANKLTDGKSGSEEGEEADASEECLGELIDLLNSDHPLMRPHVDSIVDPYLVKVGDDKAQKRRELAEVFFDRTEPSQRRTRIHAWINPRG